MRKDIFKEVGKEGGTYLETGRDKIDKEKSKIEGYNSDDLLKCYEEWSGEEAGEGIQDPYQIATELLKKYKIPSLSEDGINEFIEGVEEKEYVYKGIFLSAIINELYKEEELHLNSDEVDFLGCYNQDKEIVIEGNSGHGTGEDMTGGKIKIYGDNFDPRKQISEFAQKGEIYHKDKLVWKDGKLVNSLRGKMKKALKYIRGDSK